MEFLYLLRLPSINIDSMISMVPDDAINSVHLAFTMFDMIGNVLWIFVWVRNKKNSF